MMCLLYSSGYKLFSNMYAHIVIANELNLNLFFLFGGETFLQTPDNF